MKLRGTVKGRTIVFDGHIGLLEGQTVEAEIRPVEGINNEAGETGPLCDSLAHRTFRPIPADGRIVTNELVNEIREELGI